MKLTASFVDIEWSVTGMGIREKVLEFGERRIRLLEIDTSFTDEEWCTKGHTGVVLDGEFYLNIDGSSKQLSKGAVFCVEEGNESHRHIPVVKKGAVRLLLFENE